MSKPKVYVQMLLRLGSAEQHFRNLRPAGSDCRSYVCNMQGPGHPAADAGQQQAAAGAGGLCAQAQGVPGLHAGPDDARGSRPHTQHRSQGRLRHRVTRRPHGELAQASWCSVEVCMQGGACWKGAACLHPQGCSGHESCPGLGGRIVTFAVLLCPLCTAHQLGCSMRPSRRGCTDCPCCIMVHVGCSHTWLPLLQELEEAEARFRDHMSHSAQQKGAPTAGPAGR